MDKVQVKIREAKTYQSEDGRKIEIWTVAGETSYQPQAQNEVDSLKQFTTAPEIFGILPVQTMAGLREVKFLIPDTITKEDAFDKFYEAAQPVLDAIKKQYDDYRAKVEAEQKKIVTAPAGTLNLIKE